MNDVLLDEVLPAAQAGEAWALRRLYDDLAPRVLAYLRARGASEPEDLTSEVFLAVLPRLPQVTGGAAGLRTFVFSVAHARLVDDLRRRSRRGIDAAYDPEQDPRRSPSAEDEGLAGVQTERVRSLLEALVPDQRDVLVLRVLGDLTVEQVAEALGKSPGAVKQLQRRGLLALKKALVTEHTDAGGVPL
jgi:RNA polymerase sigma-70 factor (ECF subfamily)